MSGGGGLAEGADMCMTAGARNLKELKAVFRKDVLKLLSEVPKSEVERQSAVVQSKVIRSRVFANALRVSVYLHMPGEIATDSILKTIFATGKKCYIPRYDVKSKQMDMLRMYSLSELDSLPTTKWKIKQPEMNDERENALLTGGLDLVICPGLAFSPNRRRLGRGMGFYDGFLRRCRSACPGVKAVALALREQIFPNVPSGVGDELMDAVVSADTPDEPHPSELTITSS